MVDLSTALVNVHKKRTGKIHQQTMNRWVNPLFNELALFKFANCKRSFPRGYPLGMVLLPTIYKAYFSGLNFREYPQQNMALYGTVPSF